MSTGDPTTLRTVESWRPLGRALLDYHRGATASRLEVHTDLWRAEYEPVAAYYRPDSMRLPNLERRALQMCRGDVLDVGAGAGRHALELERRGHSVVALDVADDAVTVMHERGVSDPRRGDVFSFTGQRFDTLLLMMHGLGVVGDVAGLSRFLTHARGLLRPGGQILGDSADLGRACRGVDLLRDRADGRYPGEVEFRLRYEDLDGAPYRWLFIDPDSLLLLASVAGYDGEIAARGSRGTYLARLVLTDDVDAG